MGQTRTDSNQQLAAKTRRAERTKCPNCGRKSALKTESFRDSDGFLEQSVTYCRWKYEGKCDYEVSRMHD